MAGAVLMVPCKAHCFSILSPDFTGMGATYAVNPQSAAASYWTQVFATPQEDM